MFFKVSYEGYDVLLALRKNHVRTNHIYDFFKNFKRSQLVDETVPAAGFNPVEYFLRDLRVTFDRFIVYRKVKIKFFYSILGGI